MATIRFTRPRADGHAVTQDVQADPGQTVMQAAVEAGIEGVVAECGGMLVCATCHVYVDPAWADRLPPAGEEENGMLDFVAAPRRGGSRLCCQITMEPALDGLVLELPDRQY